MLSETVPFSPAASKRTVTVKSALPQSSGSEAERAGNWKEVFVFVLMFFIFFMEFKIHDAIIITSSSIESIVSTKVD